MNRLPLSQGKEIFSQRSEKQAQIGTQAQKKNVKAGTFLKTTGVIGSMAVLVFVINGVVAAGQAVLKPQTANTITDQTTPPATPGIMQFLPREQTQAPTVKAVTLAQTSTQSTPNNTTTTIANHEPVTPENLGALVNQISQANASIASNMQACIQLSQQAQAQISQMRAAEHEMQDAITAISREMINLDPNDPNRPAIRAQLQAQRDQIISQRNQLLRDIGQTKSQFNRAKGECQNSVYRQQNAKRGLENQLNNAFNRSIRISAY